MDRISLSIYSVLDYKDDQDYCVRIEVNGRDLLDIIREVELPFATRDRRPNRAGGYHGLPPKAVFLPSRHWLDQPDRLYCDHGRRAIYRCICGDVGCGPIIIDLDISEDAVTWRNFENPWHSLEWTKEPWDYSSLKFTFDKEQYLSELSKVSESELEKYRYVR